MQSKYHYVLSVNYYSIHFTSGAGPGERTQTDFSSSTMISYNYTDSPSVIGVSCFVGGRLHGYLYDVATKARLVSSFSFTSETSAVASDGMLFHALSQGTVETFSNRAMQVGVTSLL